MSEDCLKLTAYFGERDRGARGPLAEELLDVFAEQRLHASVLLRGAEGFGRLHRPHTDRLLTLSEDLPVVAVALGTRERIEDALGQVRADAGRGIVTLERARLLGDQQPEQPASQAGEEAKLTIHLGRGRRAGRRPAFVAACERLHELGVAGATVLVGVDGTRHGERRRARFFAANADVPAIVIAVGPSEQIARAGRELRDLGEEPLLTLERVQVCKRDGELLGVPRALPATDEHGRALWQKLTVYVSQADTHGGRPLGQELVRRLRASDAAGATALRGVWGFHGAHAPHGDRFFQTRRHVPLVTVAIDSPERTAASFRLIDELTSERGLVTCETVPTLARL